MRFQKIILLIYHLDHRKSGIPKLGDDRRLIQKSDLPGS